MPNMHPKVSVTKASYTLHNTVALSPCCMFVYLSVWLLFTEYGGTCEIPLGESPFEKQLLEIVESALEEHDMEFVEASLGIEI